MYTRQRSYSEAISSYEQALAVHALGDADTRLYTYTPDSSQSRPSATTTRSASSLLVEQKKWAPAASALESALAKGGLADPAPAELLLGIARFELGEFPAARSALEKAAASDKTRAEAREWLEEIDDRK